jgi:hypothetical protein
MTAGKPVWIQTGYLLNKSVEPYRSANLFVTTEVGNIVKDFIIFLF